MSCAGFTGTPVADPNAASVFDLCSPRHHWLNGGLALLGVLHLAGVALTWRAWPRTRLGLAALALGASGALLHGFAPVSQHPLGLHLTGAVTALVMGNVGAVLMGLAVLRRARVFAAVSLAMGTLGLAGALLYGIEFYPGLGRGGTERVAAYAAILWFALAGAMVLAEALRGGRRKPTVPLPTAR